MKVNECIEMLKEGKYNDYIKNNISPLKRVGIIKRNDYWNLYPEYRDEFISNFGKEDIDFFLKDCDKKCEDRIKDMTANKYYEYCYLSYKELGYDVDNMSMKEVYLKYADGRDEGLRKINLDSSEEFDNWYNDKNRLGGHPWEIIVGHSFSRINLWVYNDDNGYYLALDGKVSGRTVDILKIYLVLRKNNVPVELYFKEEVKKYVLEEDYIGIVPVDVLPIWGSSYFPDRKLISYMNLRGKDKKILDKIEWQDIEKVYLK